MFIGYLNLVIAFIALYGSTEGRPARRHSKRISDLGSQNFAKPPSVDQLIIPVKLGVPLKPEPPSDTYKNSEKKEEYLKPEPIKPHIQLPHYKSKIGGGKIKVQTRPNYISDKRPPVEGSKKDKELYQIPPKISDIKILPFVERTHRPVQGVEQTTSEYFTQSTRGLSTPTPLPPWRSQQFIDLVELHQETNKSDQIGGTAASLAATSTTPDFSTKCNCQLIEKDKLYNYLVAQDNYGYEYDAIQAYQGYRRYDLINMGLYTNEQAKRCYRYCIRHTPSMSQSFSSRHMPTHASNEIEIVTGAVDPDATSMIHARQHCYMTLKHKNLTANDSRLCLKYYKPTKDSPHPSSKPEGLNVWTCCKTITPRGYY